MVVRVQDALTNIIDQRVYSYDKNSNILNIDTNTVSLDESNTESIVYLYTDHLMTNRLATNDTQQVVWRWEGEAFGNTPAEELGGVSVNLRFPGQYYDSEPNLHYNWNRHYNPTLGRYITSDPIGLGRGVNTYAYAYGNPLNYIDYLGLAGLFTGPETCHYYEEQCNDSCGSDTYASNAKKCCESFGDNFFSNCTRKCLIDSDKGKCAGLTGKTRNDCRRKAHYWCYVACLNLPDAAGTFFGVFPPVECIEASEAIDEMY